MLPVNTGGHSTYQNFVVENLRKYYPNPDALSRSTWDIIDRFWNLDLSYTDELMRSRYSVFGPRPRTPSCMQRSYLLSIDFKVTLLTDWAALLSLKKSKSLNQKGLKRNLLKKLPLNSCSRHLSRNLSPLMSILTVLYSDYTRKSSLSSLLNVNLLHRNLLQLPEMGLR